MPYVHEVTSDILNLVKMAGSFADKIDTAANGGYNNSRNSTGLNSTSIMRASKDLVMSFPVLCDNTVSPSTAIMVTKAIERMCVAQLQLLFSSAYVKGNDGREVLRQWHKNMNQDMGIDDFLAISDSITGTPSYGGGWNKGVFEASLERVAEDMKNQFLSEMIFYPETSFSESAIMDYTVDDRFGENTVVKTPTRYIKEDIQSNIDDVLNRVDLADKSASNRINAGKVGVDMYNAKETNRHNKKLEKDADERRKETERHNRESEYQNMQKHALDVKKYQSDKDQFAAQQALARSKANVDYFKAQLLDSDVKKANELVPSLMIIRYNVVDANNPQNHNVVQEFIAGVKARLISCSAREIQDNITSVTSNRVSLVNLIRATTKEISFAKDFVAAIDQAKIDAKQSSRLSKTSPIWRSLQARATKSGLNRLRKNKANDASAITSLIISMELSNVIKNDKNIDLSNPKVAAFIMESYNLMALVVVDEQTETAHFLLDGEKYYQDYTFGALERETGDGSYKKIINLISKINRG